MVVMNEEGLKLTILYLEFGILPFDESLRSKVALAISIQTLSHNNVRELLLENLKTEAALQHINIFDGPD